jgi:hypothetical protein
LLFCAALHSEVEKNVAKFRESRFEIKKIRMRCANLQKGAQVTRLSQRAVGREITSKVSHSLHACWLLHAMNGTLK